MSHSMEFEGIVSQGRFKPLPMIHEALRKAEGKRIAIKISEFKPYSSGSQRKYYFAVIVEAYLMAFKEAGNDMDKDEVHIWLKSEVGNLWKYITAPDGSTGRTLRSYRRLTKPETEKYHTQCRAKAAELGIDIPEPNECS